MNTIVDIPMPTPRIMNARKIQLQIKVQYLAHYYVDRNVASLVSVV